MNCSLCGKPINPKKTFIESLANDGVTVCSVQHVACFNKRLPKEEEDEDEES